MLTSKPPYTPLAMPPTQTPTTSYHLGPAQKSAIFGKSQDGTGFMSPTESEFSDVHDGLQAVR